MSSNCPEAACCSSSKNGPDASNGVEITSISPSGPNWASGGVSASSTAGSDELPRESMKCAASSRITTPFARPRLERAEHGTASIRQPRANVRLSVVSATTCSASIGDAAKNRFTKPSATPACSREVATSVTANSSPR